MWNNSPLGDDFPHGKPWGFQIYANFCRCRMPLFSDIRKKFAYKSRVDTSYANEICKVYDSCEHIVRRRAKKYGSAAKVRKIIDESRSMCLVVEPPQPLKNVEGIPCVAVEIRCWDWVPRCQARKFQAWASRLSGMHIATVMFSPCPYVLSECWGEKRDRQYTCNDSRENLIQTDSRGHTLVVHDLPQVNTEV